MRHLGRSIKKRYRKLMGLQSSNGRPAYDYYLITSRKEALQAIEKFESRPLISIITPVYNVEPKWLKKMIASVKQQYYPNWELCIVDDASTHSATREYLKGMKSEPRIKVKLLDSNLNISGASNEALKMAKGEYIALLDHDDEITPDALFQVVKVINEFGAEFIYSDEDKLDKKGRHCEANFKPDFSLDLLLSQNYICHFTTIKKEIVNSVGGFELGLEGSQDHDLFLKCVEKTKKIYHIPKILYHWRMIEGSTAAEFGFKSYAQQAGRRAVSSYLLRNEIMGTVSDGLMPGTYRVKRSIIGNPLVSIIIPFKDRSDLLDVCLNSIISKSTYTNFEIIGLSNNSTDAATFALMKKYERFNIKFIEHNIPFNYSSLNNYAAGLASGEHLLLLNNDVEIISENWIESLLEHSQRPEVAVVGAKLLYPDGRIQHAGVGVGVAGSAVHWYRLYPGNSFGHFGRAVSIQNISAVTGACLMVKKAIFKELNGLEEENLTIAFNDIDFCLRARERGYLNVFTPYSLAYHHESVSRGYEDTPEKLERVKREMKYLAERHPSIFEEGDPYYNPNLTRDWDDFSLGNTPYKARSVFQRKVNF